MARNAGKGIVIALCFLVGLILFVGWMSTWEVEPSINKTEKAN